MTGAAQVAAHIPPLQGQADYTMGAADELSSVPKQVRNPSPHTAQRYIPSPIPPTTVPSALEMS